jgi:hypothetical protein
MEKLSIIYTYILKSSVMGDWQEGLSMQKFSFSLP